MRRYYQWQQSHVSTCYVHLYNQCNIPKKAQEAVNKHAANLLVIDASVNEIRLISNVQTKRPIARRIKFIATSVSLWRTKTNCVVILNEPN